MLELDPFANLNPSERRRLLELLGALRTGVNTWFNPESRLLGPVFAEEFTSRLLCQHVFLGSPLRQQGFDAAFMASAKTAGHRVEPALDGQRFWDLALDGIRLSLKTTEAKDLREETLHISKLTEAAWIQDCRTAKARQERTISLFGTYRQEVHAIFQFRYFKARCLYELVEIPVALFEPILHLPRTCFTADGPSINIPIGQIPPDFTLKLDRSDAKITIANIMKSRCILHGVWEMPTNCPL
jgi:hypothetical protein